MSDLCFASCCCIRGSENVQSVFALGSLADKYRTLTAFKAELSSRTEVTVLDILHLVGSF